MDWAGATEEYSCPGPLWQVRSVERNVKVVAVVCNQRGFIASRSFTKEVFQMTAFGELVP